MWAPMRRRRGPTAGGVLAVGAMTIGMCTAAACGDAPDDRLVVFAASSLTDVFTELEREFETAHPDVDVVVNVGGSSSLATQIEQAAPADVFAAADEATMDRVVAHTSPASEPADFATNRLVIAVEAGNPSAIDGLDDLTDPELIVVLAAPEVPAGAYAAAALDAAGLDVHPDSYEQSVRSVASKIGLGEADAGIVYATDVAADPRIDGVALTAGPVATYPIVALDGGDDARAFVDLVLGPTGRRALTAAGFEVP